MKEPIMIKATYGQILRQGDGWLAFCGEFGVSEWAVNEGGENVEVSLTVEQARKHGLI